VKTNTRLCLPLIFLICIPLIQAQNSENFFTGVSNKKMSPAITAFPDAASVSRDTTPVKKSGTGPTVLTPSPQLAMSSPDYPVTAGDIYILAFAAGPEPVTYTIAVDTTYRIRVANLAVIDAANRTFLQLKKEVEEIVTRNYPLSGVQFILSSPAVFKICVKGEVQQTEIRDAWALTRLSSVIAGTQTEYSSVRNITITSSSGVLHVYDLFKAERFGDLSQNPYVRPDDVITIGRAERKVTISGAVERPGMYELLEGENLKALVRMYSGGLADQADTSRMELVRGLNKDFPSGEKQYLLQSAIDDDYRLLNYDAVTIPFYTDLKPVMFMEGALYASGGTTPEGSTRKAVMFTTGENYASLVREQKSMFSAVSDTEHAYIIRNGKTFPLNMNRILYDASYYTTEIVYPDDTLMVPFRQYFVTVSGAVETPGRYPYIPDRDFSYYIGLAGGFSSEKNAHSAIVITDVNGRRLKKTDPVTPETNILAQTNSFTFYFSKYSPVLTTVLSSIATIVTIYAVTR
jgi:polysaccharide biosynthesis/export protein